MSLKGFCVFSVCIPAFLTVLQLPSQNQSDCTVFWDSCCFKECHRHFQLHLPGPSSQSLLLQRKTLQYYNNRETSEARSTESHYSINEFEIATTLCLWNTSSAQCNGIWFCSLAASLCVQPLCIHVSWVTAGVFCWSGLYCSVIHPVASLTTTQRFLMLWVCLMIELFGELSLI